MNLLALKSLDNVKLVLTLNSHNQWPNFVMRLKNGSPKVKLKFCKRALLNTTVNERNIPVVHVYFTKNFKASTILTNVS